MTNHRRVVDTDQAQDSRRVLLVDHAIWAYADAVPTEIALVLIQEPLEAKELAVVDAGRSGWEVDVHRATFLTSLAATRTATSAIRSRRGI